MAFVRRGYADTLWVSKYPDRTISFFFGSERGIDSAFAELLLRPGVERLSICDVIWTPEGEKTFLEMLPKSDLQSLTWTGSGGARIGDVVRALPRTTIECLFINDVCVNDSDVQAFGSLWLRSLSFCSCAFADGTVASVAAANRQLAELSITDCSLEQREFELLCDVLGSESHSSLIELDLTNNEITDFSPLERVVKANPLRMICLQNNNGIASLANVHIFANVAHVILPRAQNPHHAFLQLMDHLYGGPAMFSLNHRLLFSLGMRSSQLSAIDDRIEFIHSKRVKRMLAFCAGKTRHGAAVPSRLPVELIRMVAEFACDWRAPDPRQLLV